MATMKHFRRALSMLAQGADAAIPRSLKAEAENVSKEAHDWMSAGGVQAFGIAEKVSGNQKLEDLSIKVYVEKKLPRARCANPVPKMLEMPGMSEKLPTDVEAIGKIELQAANTGRVRPAVPGFSVSPFNVNTSGTLGCVVRKKGKSSPLYILSNSHAIASSGLATAGDAIVQPGTFDGGKAPDDAIGKLSEWIPFEFTDSTFPNLVDAAIAEVDPGSVSSAVPVVGVPAGVSTVVRRGMQVRKLGRTSDYSVALVKDVDVMLPLTYAKAGGGVGRVGFSQQVLSTFYTAGGDSGSAVFNMDGKVVGLHFAGSEVAGIFNKIDNVLRLLDLEVVTETIPAASS